MHWSDNVEHNKQGEKLRPATCKLAKKKKKHHQTEGGKKRPNLAYKQNSHREIYALPSDVLCLMWQNQEQGKTCDCF